VTWTQKNIYATRVEAVEDSLQEWNKRHTHKTNVSRSSKSEAAHSKSSGNTKAHLMPLGNTTHATYYFQFGGSWRVRL